ncbi:DUF1552 domain-containing protein [Myxococcota bacterium]|nr:DUF1552 domain-containing protein [Myxococcota bacterium]
MKPLSRRTVLRGLLGGAAVTVGLPLLEAMLGRGRAFAQDAGGFPKRFGLFFWGNGVLPEKFVPPNEGRGFTLSEQLVPFAPLKGKFSIVSGMRILVPNVEPHFATAAGMLSGRPLFKSGNDYTFDGPSIDQVIAAGIGQETRFSSLESAALPSRGLSFNGPNSQNPPEAEPAALFARIFGGGFRLPGDGAMVDPAIPVERSVLDALMGDVARLQGRLGASDRQRLEQHLDGLRAIEKRLRRLEEDPPNLAACAYPTEPLPAYPDIEGRPQLREKNRIQAEILAMALACDQTRVFSQFYTHPVNNVLFPGIPAGHHQLTHDEPGDQPQVNAITIQCMEAFAEFLQALDAIPEGDGTLLDHTVVLGTSDVAWGKTHSPEDFPVVLAGSAGGALAMDVHYRSPSGESASNVLLTLCRAMGMDLPAFGAGEGYTTTSVSAVEA